MRRHSSLPAPSCLVQDLLPRMQGLVCRGQWAALGKVCWDTEGGRQGIRSRRGGCALEADTPPGVQPSPLIME